MQIQSLLFVINPFSGPGFQDYKYLITQYFNKYPSIEIDFFIIDWKDTPKKLILEKLKQKSYDVVVACGGDGTVGFVAEILYGKNYKMGILPTGSANGLASNLKIPANIEGALEIIRVGNTMPVSSLTVNGYFCIHLADVGLNADIVKEFEIENRRGIWGYISAFRTVYFRQRRTRAIAKINNKIIHTYFYMLAFCNGTGFGTGLTINPDGRLDDNVFEVVNVRHLSLIEILKLFLGKEKPSPAFVKITSCKQIDLELSRPLHLQVDGEALGKVDTVSVSLNDAFINFLVPA